MTRHTHKTDEARQRCWSCSHPERLVPTSEEDALVRDLLAKGYLSVSRSSGTITTVVVPPFEEAIVFAADVPEWLRARLRDCYLREVRLGHRTNATTEVHLSPAAFQLFKQLGGDSAP